MRTLHPGFLVLCMCVCVAGSVQVLSAGKKHPASMPNKTPPEQALRSYIERVRAQHAAEVATTGSIWSSDGRLVRLGTDAKAVRIHDVVSIVVIESLAASTDGQVKNVRASNASSSVSSLLGAIKASNSLSEPGRSEFFVGADGTRTEHHKLKRLDNLRRRGRGCFAERHAGRSGDAAAHVFTADTAHQAAGPCAAGGCERAKPGAFDSHDRS